MKCKMTTISNRGEYITTDELEVMKWVASTMVHRHRGVKDVKRITYDERYDGMVHATYHLSNDTKVVVDMEV